MTVDTLMHFASDSGGVLYIIAAMLLVALTVILERSWFLSRLQASGRRALEQLDQLGLADASALSTIALRHRNLPVGRMFDLAAQMSGERSREKVGAMLEETVMREAPCIDRFLWVLDTIVTLAPLLGLFGTIVGMFHSFQVLSNPGNAPTQVTAGVADALVATASGLFVAMIGLVFFNGLHNRVRLAAHQLEILKTSLVNRLCGFAVELPSELHGRVSGLTALASQGA